MLTIHPTTKSEASILSEIQKQAFKPLYDRYHDAGNPHLRGPEDVLRRLNNPIFRHFTILWDEKIVGAIYYHTSGSTLFIPELKPGEYYLGRVYILPEFQSRHFARQAIALCEKEFSDMKTCYVDFPADLDKNRRCYTSAGFTETGITREIQPNLTLELLKKQL